MVDTARARGEARSHAVYALFFSGAALRMEDKAKLAHTYWRLEGDFWDFLGTVVARSRGGGICCRISLLGYI